MAVAALVAATAASGDVNILNFDVQINGRPPTPGSAPSPHCTTSGTTENCTFDFDAAQAGVSLDGTVNDSASGLSGTIQTTCDFDMHGHGDMHLESGSSSITVNGSGSQRCVWHMAFPAATSLDGTLTGESSMSLSGTDGTLTGTMTVNVVAGTGRFAGQVGSGTFTETHSFTAPTPSVPSGPGGSGSGSGTPGSPPSGAPTTTILSGAPPSGTTVPTGPPPTTPPTTTTRAVIQYAILGAVVKTPGISKMHITLHAGAPRTAIISPPAKLTAKTDGGVRLATKPGATCSGKATAGGKSVALGSATDTNHDGVIVLVPKLRPKLQKGSWTVGVSCGTSSASTKVSVS